MSTELIEQLREYVGNPGYSHLDYADCMKEAADRIADLERQNTELVRQLAAQSKDSVSIPREIVLFLLGEGPLDGMWFGDSDTDNPRPRYWWRTNLRAAMQAGKEPTK